MARSVHVHVCWRGCADCDNGDRDARQPLTTKARLPPFLLAGRHGQKKRSKAMASAAGEGYDSAPTLTTACQMMIVTRKVVLRGSRAAVLARRRKEKGSRRKTVKRKARQEPSCSAGRCPCKPEPKEIEWRIVMRKRRLTLTR